MLDRRRLPLVIGAVVAATLLAGAGVVLWLRGGTPPPAPTAARASSPARPPGFGTTVAQSGTATTSRQDAAAALCRIEPATLRGLTRLSSSQARVENLRDGLPALQDRLSQLQLVATGRPALTPVIKDLTRVERAWTAAITAADGGHHAKAVAALAAADRQLAVLGPHLDAAYPRHLTDCA